MKLQYRLAEHIAIRPVCPKGTEEPLKKYNERGGATKERLRDLLLRMAMPYPFSSSSAPTWVSVQRRSVMYSIVVDSMRKA